MKLIVNKKDGYVVSVSIEYTPTEALVINHAMRRYVDDEEMNEVNRNVMERMLDVEPIFREIDGKRGRMTKAEHDKIIQLMNNGALKGIDTGRLDGKCEDVIPLEDAIAIIRKIYAESEGKNDT